MPDPRSCNSRRRGFSYLETQVAMVLFMMTVSGVVPLAVIQTRQLSRVESRFEPGTTQYLNQPQGRWARKLGAPAILSDTPPKPDDPTSEEAWAILTVDDQDAGYREKNKSWDDWWHFTWSAAYGEDFTMNFPDGAKDIAIWEFKDLKPAKYTILASYPTFPFANGDANYVFFLNGKEEDDKKVDQTKPIDEPLVDGVRWKKLDEIKVETKNATIRVELSDEDATGYNVIDAMRLVPEVPKMFLHKLDAPMDEKYVEVRVHVEFPDGSGHDDDDDDDDKDKDKDKDKGKGKGKGKDK